MKEDKTNKRVWLVFGVYLLLSILLFDPKLHTGGDNARYVILAESLSRFRGFLDLQMPGTPAHTQYPFGFPLLLVPFLWLFGKSYVILKMVPLLCGLGGFVFFYLLMRRVLARHWFYPVLFFAFTPILIEYNHWLFSEMPFLFFSLGSLYFFSRYREKALFFVLACAFAVYAYFIRTAGISLVAGIGMTLVYKREWSRFLIFAVIFAVPFGLWQYRSSRIPQEWSYIDQLLSKDPYNPESGRLNFWGMLGRIKTNFLTYLFAIVGISFFPALKVPAVSVIVGLLFLGAVVYGLVSRRKRLDFIDFYLVFSLGNLLVWPSVWSGDRFLLPIMPLLLFYLIGGLARVLARLKLRYGLVGAGGLFILLNLFAIVPALGRGFSTGYPVDYQRYFEVCDWLGRNTAENSVVVARKPEFVYLIAGRQSVLYPFSYDGVKVLGVLVNSDYVILDNFLWTATSRRYLGPVIEQNPERFELVFQTPRPEFYLLRVLK